MTMLEGGLLERVELDESLLEDTAECGLYPKPHRLIHDRDTVIPCSHDVFGLITLSCSSNRYLICRSVFDWVENMRQQPVVNTGGGVTMGWICSVCHAPARDCWVMTKV